MSISSVSKSLSDLGTCAFRCGVIHVMAYPVLGDVLKALHQDVALDPDDHQLATRGTGKVCQVGMLGHVTAKKIVQVGLRHSDGCARRRDGHGPVKILWAIDAVVDQQGDIGVGGKIGKLTRGPGRDEIQVAVVIGNRIGHQAGIRRIIPDGGQRTELLFPQQRMDVLPYVFSILHAPQSFFALGGKNRCRWLIIVR